MFTEYELRILNIDKDAVIKKLESIGAEKVHDEELQQRHIMDFPDNRLWQDGGWVRVRKVGALRTELSYKQRSNQFKIDSAKEIYLEVSDYEGILEFLRSVGFVERRYQENRRLRYQLGEVIFDIDTWPGKKPYIEVESTSERAVKDAVVKLGFTEEDCSYVAGPALLTLLGFADDEVTDLRFENYEKDS